MKSRLSRSVIIFLALFCGATSSQADIETTRTVIRRLADQIKYYTLDNGIRVIMFRRGIAPVFAGAVVVRVGGSDETPGETGIAHMLEHMAFKGTPEIGTKNFSQEQRLLRELETIVAETDEKGVLPAAAQARWDAVQASLQKLWLSEQYTREFENRGATGMNATTDSELTRYFVNMPRAAFEFWCAMEAARILKPVMRQFYQERDVVLEERRMRFENQPDGKLYEQLLGLSYLMHPYRNPVIGYESDIRALTATKIADFHKRYYVPGNIVVSLVGDIDPDRDIELVRKHFGAVAVGPVPKRPMIQESEQMGERMFRLRAPSAPQLLIAYRKPNYPHPDDAPITVATRLLSASSRSPLYRQLLQEDQIISGVDVDEGPGMAYPNLAIFQLTPKGKHTNDETLRAFDRVLDQVKSQPIDQELLTVTKRGIALEHLEQMKSNQTLALNLAGSESLFGSWRAVIDWYDAAMVVTPEDVKRVLNQYFVAEKRTVGKLESSEK